MGNKPATYQIEFEVRMDEMNDISFFVLNKTWDNFNAVYEQGDYSVGTHGISDGLVIEIPPYLEGIGPIDTSVTTDRDLILQYLITERIEKDSKVFVKIRNNWPMKNGFLGGGSSFAAYIFQCKIPGSKRKLCIVTWKIYVKFASALRAVQNDFSLSYFESTFNFSNGGVRVSNDGSVSYGNKELESNNSQLKMVNVATITDLSNENGQFILQITLVNINGILELTYDNTLSSIVSDVSVNDTSIIVTTSVDIPVIGYTPDIVGSSVKIPNKVIFDATYPSARTIHLTPRIGAPLTTLVADGQDMTVSFLAVTLING